jgi:hypothetical protein
MRKFTNPLDGVRVAAPCRADWEKMVGDERMRYCGECSLHVYNLSGMTKREAEALIANAEGRLCVRFYRRADGTVLTRNCPVGLRALKRRVSRVAGATLSAVLGFFAGVGFNFGFGQPAATTPHTMGEVVQRLPKQEEVEIPPPPPPRDTHPMMGAVAPRRPTVGKIAVGTEQPHE